MREDIFTPDKDDAKRVEWCVGRWKQQDFALRRRDRQIEESLRMLAGQQWTVWNPWLQKWMDVTEWMTDDERRWRQRPVINRLLYWYILTHARLTENPPILTFQPSTGDRLDAELAEVMDTIFKSKWRAIGMSEVIDRLVGWLIPGGRGYLQSVLDPHGGEFQEFTGPAEIPMMDATGQTPLVNGMTGQPMTSKQPKVPHDKEGNPLAYATEDGRMVATGEPHMQREGDIRVDVLSPLQCRGQWGPVPWHQKRFHMTRTFLTSEEIWEMFNVEAEGENPAVGQTLTDPGFLHRVFFGSGWYGAASNKPGSEWSVMPTQEKYVEVYSYWEKPGEFPGMEEDPEEPGGRLLVTTKTKVLRDGSRPIAFRYTSGLRCFDFVSLPGRPSGTSPQEMLNPLQRTYNRMAAQILENANLHANPIGIIDQASGLGQVEMTNKPGERFVVQRRPNVPAFEYVQPPSLGRDVYQSHTMLKTEMQDLGHIEGAEGRAPTPDPSGKLIRELRFNSDRFLGATARRMVEELARMAEDWQAILKICWDQEKIIAYAGDDTVTRTMAVYPEMFKEGTVNVVADVESMLPQSRSERQQQVVELYELGAWGQPGSPPAVMKLLELARFPHISRTAWPGGVHITTAQRENGMMLRGTPWEQIVIFDWYDDVAHLLVHENFMASPEYLRLSPGIQQSFAIHRELHQKALMAKQMKQVQQQTLMQTKAAVVQATGAKTAAAAVGAPDPISGPQASGQGSTPAERGEE